MSYEIKKAYLVGRGVAGPGRAGFSPPFWVWSLELAERLLVTNGRSPETSNLAWEVIVIEGDILLTERTLEGTNTVTKIEVVEDTEESLRAATLRRFTEHQKKILGIPYDEALMAEQGAPSGFAWGSFDHDRMISRAYDLSDYEAELLGLSEEHTTAHTEFQEILRNHPEKHDV